MPAPAPRTPDEKERPPLPSWLPEDLRRSTRRRVDEPTPHPQRALAVATIVLGVLGVVAGLVAREMHTEVLLGALLVVFGVRALVR